MSNSNCRALLESVHEELTNMGFGTDQSIDGADFVEYGGKLFVDIGEAIERDKETTSAIEAATKAAQTADLLIRDLQDLNRSGGMLVSMLVLPEIAKATQIKDRAANILAALNGAA